MSNDVFFYRKGESFNEIQNEFTDFLPEVILHPKTTLNCAVVFAANMRVGVLLDRVNPLLCKLSSHLQVIEMNLQMWYGAVNRQPGDPAGQLAEEEQLYLDATNH